MFSDSFTVFSIFQLVIIKYLTFMFLFWNRIFFIFLSSLQLYYNIP
nr:MAG TPA: hypothetical protein [Caudoviricetes sp.]